MKRKFRSDRRATASAEYPVHLEGRRRFMQQLGLVVAGGAVASVLPGCGTDGRAVGKLDARPGPRDATGGIADVQPSPRDTGWWSDGVAPDVLAPRDLSSGGIPDAPPAGGDSFGIPDTFKAPADLPRWSSDGLPSADTAAPVDLWPPGDASTVSEAGGPSDAGLVQDAADDAGADGGG